MDWMSEEDRRGCEQNVQGPRPSLTQTIFPQLRQFGAAARRGCRVAMQLQRRLALSEGEDVILGFVWISRVRMAESRSLIVDDWPCIGVPPDRFTFVFGPGEDVRLEGDLKSEIRRPAADGGGFGDASRDEVVDAALGSCNASGLSCSARALANGDSLRGLAWPAM